MATYFTSTNMGLVIPVTGSATGPDWANDLNASLLTVDAHDHTSGNGVLIVPSAMNIDADLTFTDNNATNLRSVRFYSQGSEISGGSDLDCLYVVTNDLYYRDGAGNQIRLTQAGNINNSIVANISETYSLAILRGTINSASSGSIVSGEGFSITRNGTGDITITFTTAFLDVPSVTATSVKTTNSVASLQAQPTTTACRILNFTSTTGSNIDGIFCFTAIGKWAG